jgi:RHS repeat-associated protein
VSVDNHSALARAVAWWRVEESPAPWVVNDSARDVLDAAHFERVRHNPLLPVLEATTNDALVQPVEGLIQALEGQEGAPRMDTAICDVVTSALGVPGLLAQVVDTALGVGIGMMMPSGVGFPAACAMTIHVGVPHAHAHPPSFVPPAPPVPLPSIGMVLSGSQLGVMIAGEPAVVCGDVGAAPTCGGFAPMFEIVTGAAAVFIGGKRAARTFDLTRVCNPIGPSSMGGSMSSVLGSAGHAVAAIVEGAGVAASFAGVGSNLIQAAGDCIEESNAGSAEEAEEAAAAAQGHAMAALMAAAQAAADAVLDAVTATIGTDPGVPPGFGMLAVPAKIDVLIGGFPVPPIGEMLSAGLANAISNRRRANGGGEGGEGGSGGGRHRDHDDGTPTRHPDANEPCRAIGCPVDAVTGEVYDDLTDIRGEWIFEFGRHYSTRLRTQRGALGFGHRHCLEVSLDVRRHQVTFHDEQARAWVFPAFRGRLEVSLHGYTLTRNRLSNADVFTLSHPAKPTRDFIRIGRVGRLARIRSELAWMDLGYSDDGQLVSAHETEMATSKSHLYTFHYTQTDGLLRDVRRDGTAIVTYYYHAESLLSETRRGHDVERCEYDEKRRVVSRRDGQGHAFYWRYDEEDRCVWTSSDSALGLTRLQYEKYATRVERTPGQWWTYHYDYLGIITRIERPDGTARSRETDPHGRVVLERDWANRTLEWLYDEKGHHTGRRDRFGNWLAPESIDRRLSGHEPPALPSTQAGYAGFVSSNGAASEWDVLHAIPSFVLREARNVFQARGASSVPVERKDALGRVVRIDDARGAQTFTYDTAGNLLESVDRDGRVVRTERSIDLVRRLIEGSRVTEFAWGTTPFLSAIRDGLGNQTDYQRDAADRITGIVRNGALRETYTWDSADRLIEKRDADGNVLLRCEPHRNALVGRIQLASGDELRFDYDARGRHTEASTKTHEVRLKRDHVDRIAFDVRDKLGVETFRDARGARTTLLGRFTFRRVQSADASQLIEPSGRANTIRQSPSGAVISRALANGTQERSQFDEEGRLTGSIAHSLGLFGIERVYTQRCVRSPEGRLMRLHDSERGVREFRYDYAGALAEETRADGSIASYRYDAAGNLIASPQLTSTSLQTGNQLTRANDQHFAFDARGRLASRTRDGALEHFEYDSFDQLIRVRFATGEDWTATYDGLGRRIEFGRGEAKTKLYWEGDRLAAEVAPTGALRLYGYAADHALLPYVFIDYASVDAPLESGKSYYPFSDPSGLPIRIEDASGEAVWTALHADPYGAITVKPLPYYLQCNAIEYRLRWPGHYFDPELGLHLNRYRDYDPQLGRYIEPDPLGHAGGINLYAYCRDPIGDVDLLGLHPQNKANGLEAAQGRTTTEGDPSGTFRDPSGRLRDAETGEFVRDPNAPSDGRIRREDVYPSSFSQRAHDEMALAHTDEGRAHRAAYDASPSTVPRPPPVRADAGAGAPLAREQMTWRDSRDQEIEFYQRDANGRIQRDRLGRPITNLTYDHTPELVGRYNSGEHALSQRDRNESFNDTSRLVPMTRSENSRRGGSGQTYQQHTPPNR